MQKPLNFDKVYASFVDMPDDEFLDHLRTDAEMALNMSEQIEKVQTLDPRDVQDSLTFIAVTLRMAAERFNSKK